MKPSDFFIFTSYKKLLVTVIGSKPRKGYGQLHKLALHLKVHSSLLSQILRGSKDFTLEQALGTARYFNFTSRETEYFLLLVQLAKAGTPDLKSFYRNQVEKCQESILEVSSRISGGSKLSESDQSVYYSDWSYMATWLATTIDPLRAPASIAATLKIPLPEIERILDFLVKAGLCEVGGDGYKAKILKTHVPASSPLARRHHVNWRLKAIEQVPHLNLEEMMFTSPMTLAAADLVWLKKQLLDLIQELSEIVKKSKAETSVCLNIDLFNIASMSAQGH